MYVHVLRLGSRLGLRRRLGLAHPFWLALPLGYITHYIRTHLEDSPVYAQMQERMKEMGEKVEHPIRTLFTKHLKVLLISFSACVLNAVGFYAVLHTSRTTWRRR